MLNKIENWRRCELTSRSAAAAAECGGGGDSGGGMPRPACCGRSALEHILGHPPGDCISQEKILYYELSKWDKCLMENEKTEKNNSKKLSHNNSQRHFSLSSCLLKKFRSARVRKQGVSSNIGLTQLPINQRQPKNKTKWQQHPKSQIEKYNQADRSKNGWQYCERQGQQVVRQQPHYWRDLRTGQGAGKHQDESQYLQGSKTTLYLQTCTLQSTDIDISEGMGMLALSGAQRRPLAQAASCCARPAAALRTHHRKRYRSNRDSDGYPRYRKKLASSRFEEAKVQACLSRPMAAASSYADDCLQRRTGNGNCTQVRQSNVQMQAEGIDSGGVKLIAAPATSLMARLWVAAVTEPSRPPSKLETSSESTLPPRPASKASTVPADMGTSSVSTEPVVYNATATNSPHATFEGSKGSSLSPTSVLSLDTGSLLDSTLSDSTASAEPGAPSYVAANDRAYWFFRNRRTLGVQTRREGRAPGRGATLIRAGHTVGGGRVCYHTSDEDQPPPPPRPPLIAALEDTTTLASRLVAGTSHCFSELHKKVFPQRNSRITEKTKTQFTQYDVKDTEVGSFFPFAADQYTVLINGKKGDQSDAGTLASWPAPAPRRLSSTSRSPPPACYCEQDIKGASCQLIDTGLSTSELDHPKKNTIQKKKIPKWKRYMNCFQMKKHMCTCLSKRNHGLRCLFCKNKSCKCTGASECSTCRQTHKPDPFRDPNFVQLLEDEVNYRNALCNKVNIFRKTNMSIKGYSSDKMTPMESTHITTPRHCQWRRKPTKRLSIHPTGKCMYCENLGSKSLIPLKDSLPCVCKSESVPEEQSQSQTTITSNAKLCGWKYEDGNICKACYKPICKCKCKPGKKDEKDNVDLSKTDNEGQKKQILQESQETPNRIKGAGNAVDRASSPVSLHESTNVDQYATEKSPLMYDHQKHIDVLNRRIPLQDSLDSEQKKLNTSEHDRIQLTNIDSQNDSDSYPSKKYTDKLSEEVNMEEKNALGYTSSIKNTHHAENTLRSPRKIIPSTHDKDQHFNNAQNEYIQFQNSKQSNQNAIIKIAPEQEKIQHTDVKSQKAIEYSSSKSHTNQRPEVIEIKLLSKNISATNSLNPMIVQDSDSFNQDTTGKSESYEQQQLLISKNTAILTPFSRGKNKPADIDSSKALDSSLTESTILKNSGYVDFDQSRQRTIATNTIDDVSPPTKYHKTELKHLQSLQKEQGTCCQKMFMNLQESANFKKEQGTCCRTIFKNIKDCSTNFPSCKELLNYSSPQNKSIEHTCCRIKKLAEIKSSKKSHTKNHQIQKESDQLKIQYSNQNFSHTKHSSKSIKEKYIHATRKRPSQYSTNETVDKLHFTIEQKNSSKVKRHFEKPLSSSKIKKNNVICQCDEQDVSEINNPIYENDKQLTRGNNQNIQPTNTVPYAANKVNEDLEKVKRKINTFEENYSRDNFVNTPYPNRSNGSQQIRDKDNVTESPAKRSLPPNVNKDESSDRKLKQGTVNNYISTSDKSTNLSQYKNDINRRLDVTEPGSLYETELNKRYTKNIYNNFKRPVQDLNNAALTSRRDKNIILNRPNLDPTTKTPSINQLKTNKPIADVSNQENMDEKRNWKDNFDNATRVNNSITKSLISDQSKHFVKNEIVNDKATQTETVLPDSEKNNNKPEHSTKQFQNSKVVPDNTLKFDKEQYNDKKTYIHKPDRTTTKSKTVIKNNLKHQSTTTKNNNNLNESKSFATTTPISDTQELKQEKGSSIIKPAELPLKIYTKRFPTTSKGKENIDITHNSSTKAIEISTKIIPNQSLFNTNKDKVAAVKSKSDIIEDIDNYKKHDSLDKSEQHNINKIHKTIIVDRKVKGGIVLSDKINVTSPLDDRNYNTINLQDQKNLLSSTYNTDLNNAKIHPKYKHKDKFDTGITKNTHIEKQDDKTVIGENIKKISIDDTIVRNIPIAEKYISSNRYTITTQNKEDNNNIFDTEKKPKRIPQMPDTKNKTKNDTEKYFIETHRRTSLRICELNKTKDASTNTVPSDFNNSQSKRCLLSCKCDVNKKEMFSPDNIFNNDKSENPIKSKNTEIRCIDDIEVKISPFTNRIISKNLGILSAKNSIFNYRNDILVIKEPSENRNESKHSSVKYSIPSKVYQFDYFDKINPEKTHLEKNNGLKNCIITSTSPIKVNEDNHTVTLKSSDSIGNFCNKQVTAENSQNSHIADVTVNIIKKENNMNLIHNEDQFEKQAKHRVGSIKNHSYLKMKMKPVQVEAVTSALSLDRQLSDDKPQHMQSHLKKNIAKENKLYRQSKENEHKDNTSNKQSVAVQTSNFFDPKYVFKDISFFTLYKYTNFDASETKATTINRENIQLENCYPRLEEKSEVFISKSSSSNLFETSSQVSKSSGERALATSLAKQRPGRHCLRAVLDARTERAARYILKIGQIQH